jgi:hypothetical protein
MIATSSNACNGSRNSCAPTSTDVRDPLARPPITRHPFSHAALTADAPLPAPAGSTRVVFEPPPAWDDEER